MKQLARFVRYVFGLEAFVFLLGFVSLIALPGHSASLRAALLALLTALVLGGLPGLAWWTLRKGKRSARAWAIAASVLNLAMGILVLSMQRRFPILRFTTLIGIAGLVAFWRKATVAAAQQPPPKVERIVGDGTSRISERFAQMVGLAGFFIGSYFWNGWALDRHLLRAGFVSMLVQLEVAGLITTAFHEAGHVLAGWQGGMLLRIFRVGPFHWKILNGRWKFQFQVREFYGGVAGMVSPSQENLRERTAVMILGGPVASLVWARRRGLRLWPWWEALYSRSARSW